MPRTPNIEVAPRAFLGYVHGRLLPRVVDEEQVFVAPPRDAAKVGALALEGKPQARRLGRRSLGSR